jgi:hypothetical protein
MNESQLIDYISTMRRAISAAGEDIAELGIEGLSSATSLKSASVE